MPFTPIPTQMVLRNRPYKVKCLEIACSGIVVQYSGLSFSTKNSLSPNVTRSPHTSEAKAWASLGLTFDIFREESVPAITSPFSSWYHHSMRVLRMISAKSKSPT